MRLTFRIPAAAEDLLAAELWARGTLGLEVRPADGGLQVEAYFARPLVTGGAAFGAAEAWRAVGAELLAAVEVPEADWMAGWRAAARPFALGRGFAVDPRDPEGTGAGPGATDGRRLLRLPARRAFGTGSHESTRLAVELLERIAVAGREALDVGTGTGILAFVCLRLGARRVVALDVDPVATFHAAANGRLNRLAPAVLAGSLAALRPDARFDLAAVNIGAAVLRAELPALVERLRPGSDALFSGILAAEGEALEADLAAAGFRVRTIRRAGEWIGWHARLDAA